LATFQTFSNAYEAKIIQNLNLVY